MRAFDRATELGLPVVVRDPHRAGPACRRGWSSLVQMARTASAARRHADAGLLSVAVLRVADHRRRVRLLRLAVRPAGRRGRRADRLRRPAGRGRGHRGGGQWPARTPRGRAYAARPGRRASSPPDEPTAWVDAALGPRATRRCPPAPLPLGPAADAAGEPAAWAEVLRGPPAATARPASTWPPGCAGRGSSCAAPTRPSGPPWPRSRPPGASWSPPTATAAPGDPRPTASAWPGGRSRLADRLGLPLVTLVDTPGADPSPEAENDGIAPEIAATFAALAACPAPTVSVCVGEGGSGGALALAWTDRLLIQRARRLLGDRPGGGGGDPRADEASRADGRRGLLKLTTADLAGSASSTR